MIKHEEGITPTYNRFHDPNEIDPDIVKLRQLHEVMDRAVLDAYGWTHHSAEILNSFPNSRTGPMKMRKMKAVASARIDTVTAGQTRFVTTCWPACSN